MLCSYHLCLAWRVYLCFYRHQERVVLSPGDFLYAQLANVPKVAKSPKAPVSPLETPGTTLVVTIRLQSKAMPSLLIG